MNVSALKIITIIVFLIFGIYAVFNLLLGDTTPLVIVSCLVLVFTVGKWGSLGVLGVLLFHESALQVPMPGKPDMWHFCGILAILGGLIDIVRQGGVIKQPPVGRLVIFCVIMCVLLALNVILILPYHDIAWKNLILNSAGRRYLKFALIYLIPVFVYLNVYSLKNIEKIIKTSYLLGLTYLVIELVLKFSPQLYPIANLLFKGSHDALAYAGISSVKGFQRYSGASTAAIALASYLLLKRKQFKLEPCSAYYWILMFTLFLCSTLGGSRAKIVLIPLACIMVLWSMKSIRMNTILVGGLTLIVSLCIVYTQYSRFPGAVQRVFTVLPGVEATSSENYTLNDTDAFDSGRDELREISKKILDENYVVGIGYKYLQYIDKDIKKGTEEGIKYYAKYDLGLMTPILMFGMLYFILVSVLCITVIFTSVKDILHLRKTGMLPLYMKLQCILMSIVLARIYFICTQTGYHKYFVEVPVTLLIFVIITRKAYHIEMQNLITQKEDQDFDNQVEELLSK